MDDIINYGKWGFRRVARGRYKGPDGLYLENPFGDGRYWEASLEGKTRHALADGASPQDALEALRIELSEQKEMVDEALSILENP